MKISNWSKAGMLFGFLFAIFTSFRFFIIYDLTTMGVICILIGINIVAVSWLYGRQLQHSNTLLAVEEYLGENNLKEVGNEK